MKLLFNDKKKKLYSDKITNSINTSDGIIDKDEFNKTKLGVIKTHKGVEFVVINPNFKDLFENIKRGPQIITLKDAAIIAAEMGLMKGHKVIDAGGGSGALTCYLANIVGSKGMIYSYEREKRFCNIIEKNKELFGFENIEVICKNIALGAKQKKVDAFSLDLPSPWEAISTVEHSLKRGGILTVYVPNATQLTIMEEKTKDTNLIIQKVVEIIQREWKVKGRICHPKFRMLGHTGFLMIYRKK